MEVDRRRLLLIVGVALAAALLLDAQESRPDVRPPKPVPKPVEPQTPQISRPHPPYQPYEQIVQQLQQWEAEAPDWVDIAQYGTSTEGRPLMAIRVTNEKRGGQKWRVLTTGQIHGNEPIGGATTMWYHGTLIAEAATTYRQLLDGMEFYFIPVICPDSHPHSRHSDGRDPNRDFPSQRSVTAVQALKDLALVLKPHAAWSGHCNGRVWFYPASKDGDASKHEAEYKRVLDQMKQASGGRFGWFGSGGFSRRFGNNRGLRRRGGGRGTGSQDQGHGDQCKS